MKKGDSQMIWIVISAAIVLIVFVVVISVFGGQFGRGQGQISCQLTNLNYDCDGDGTVGTLDNCPCDSDITTLSQGEKCGTVCTKEYQCVDGTNLKC